MAGSRASAAPDAIRAIASALKNALGANVAVLIGPGATDDPGLNGLVMVGVNDADEAGYAEAVTGTQQFAYLDVSRTRREDFTVHCVAVAWNGEPDGSSDAMDAVYALVGAATQALVTDPTLNGVLLTSPGVTSNSLKFTTDDNGSAAHVQFDIQCVAYI